MVSVHWNKISDTCVRFFLSIGREILLVLMQIGPRTFYVILLLKLQCDSILWDAVFRVEALRGSAALTVVWTGWLFKLLYDAIVLLLPKKQKILCKK